MTVLLAYVPGPQGDRVLEAGIAEAQLRDAGLHIVTVLGHETGDSPTRVRREFEDIRAAQAHLDRLGDEIGGYGIKVTTVGLHSRPGEASQQLLDAIRAVRPELVVVGMRRRSRVGKAVLGSVSQDLLLRADAPVLAVRAREADGAPR